VVWSFK